MTGVLLKGGSLDTDRNTGRRPHEEEGRGLADDSATSQGPAKVVSDTPEARGEARTRSSPMAPRGNQPCVHLDLGFQPPELRENTVLLSKPPSVWYSVTVAEQTNTCL